MRSGFMGFVSLIVKQTTYYNNYVMNEPLFQIWNRATIFRKNLASSGKLSRLFCAVKSCFGEALMNYLEGEREILCSDNGELVLTNFRVRQTIQGSGLSKLSSIMLEEISACETTYRSQPIFAVLAAVSLLIGLGLFLSNSRDAAPLIIAVVVAAFLVLCYFASRRQVLSISAGNSRIDSRITGKRMEACLHFIDSLEAAKDQRYRLKAKSGAVAQNQA